MRVSSLALPVALLAVTAGCTQCEDIAVNQPQRRIAVDVCTGGANLNGKGGVEGCEVDFGSVNLSERVTREITLSNVSEQDLTVDSFQFTPSSDPAFAVDHLPSALKAGMSSKMIISFGPMLESAVEGDIILVTNAENAKNPQDGQVTIHVKGIGVDNGLPELRVEVLDQEVDACCDLGLVASGSAANCRLRLVNTGERALVLQEVKLVETETDGPWTPVGAMPTDPTNHADDAQFTIMPAGSSTITFRFTPTDMEPHKARVLLRTNAPGSCGPAGVFGDQVCARHDPLDPCPSGQAGVVTVDLRGQGVDPPLCIARVKSVNGSTQFDPRQIEPLDDVQVTAEDSTPSAPGITITGYAWTITRKPPGSGARLDDPVGAAPHFVFDNTSTNVITGLDVAGEYEVHCVATDSRGMKSINESQATVAFAAVPSEAIHLQLVWDSPATDVDLHLMRESSPGSFQFDDEQDDCYYANCKPDTGGPLWDNGHRAHEGGNPVLDVDDVEGYGPENSNVDEPLPGRYKALVYYFSDHGNGPTVATLRVYLYGNLVAEYQRYITNQQKWDVGIVEWPSAAWTGIDQIVP